MNESGKYNQLRNNLKKLSRIKTRPDFNQKLLSRIRTLEHEKYQYSNQTKVVFKDRTSWLVRFFKPALVPVATLSVIFLILTFIYYFNIYQNKQEVTIVSQDTPASQEENSVSKKESGEDTKNISKPEISEFKELQTSKPNIYQPLTEQEEIPSTKDASPIDEVIEQKIEGIGDETEETHDKTGNMKISPKETDERLYEKEKVDEKDNEKLEKKSKHSDIKSSKVDSTKKDSTKTDSLIHQNINLEDKIDDTIKQEAPSEIKEK